MSEAFTALTVPEAIAAAHRIYERADQALTIRRAFDGVPDRELISIVNLARQLDVIARHAAEAETALRPVMTGAPAEAAYAVGQLAGLLRVAGYLPLPAQEEPAHGEG